MTNVTRKTTNKFTKGLVMDFSPENTRNEVLTNALNATLLTFNGNELSLQNDMGNARVETAYLPSGYIPVGTCEYGGIIYIVSYNPLEDKSLIGCFPSPERNVSRDELGEPAIRLTNEYFQGTDGEIIHNTQCVLLKSNNLNPGDKFVITANESIYGEALSDLYIKDADTNTYSVKENPILALNVVSIEDSGKIVYLNSSVRQYENGDCKYHILGTNNTLEKSVEDYRNVLSSGYNVFKSKTSGKLAILAELIMIDSYSVTHSIKPAKILTEAETETRNTFDIIIHTEVSPTITENNKNTAPKLKYYYLKNSKGYLQKPDETINILSDKYDDDINLSDLYEDLTLEGNLFKDSNGNSITLEKDNFKFPLENTYHEIENSTTYNDVKLASVTIPDVIANNGLDLPFKYDYTLVPCMNYGKLDHLAVSNTISFDKLHDFERSDFNVWKYKIDDNLLRLTFGTEVFDTYEEHKVDGLILEFYDCWGFAGSVEITDKKSYSGVFTKILSLNTVDAISKKRVVDNEYKETQFARDIKITTNGEGYVYNGKSVEHNKKIGWYYKDDDNKPLEVSDCGTLYSNIIYGVKTYLKRTTVDTEEYIPKRDFFLYTLPILNDYYYSVEDFSNIENPELDFVLTYKLVNNNDNNIRTEYSEGDFTNGYNATDNDIIGDYLSGNYTSDDPIDVTKYYNYKGTSDLYLEIGLKKDYEALNIAYDPEINTKFSCTLNLLNDEGESSVLVEKDLLNYGNYKFDNILEFEDTKKKTSWEITTDGENTGIKKHNFLNSKGEPIKINYNFIVGYKANISNIRETQVPVTTVCALCHKREDGTYNYEDFGIYERVFTTNNGEEIKYLSSSAFYNEGDESTSIFGVCRQVNYEGNNAEQWQPVDEILTEVKDIKIPGKFNSGEPLKLMSKYIGKLLFYQPYILTISNEYGTNVQKDGSDNMEIQKSGSANKDIQSVNQSIISLNTKNSIDYYSEFIATIAYRDAYTNNSVRDYVHSGISSIKFNKSVVDIMKHVYAYNPDYDQLKVNVGEVTLQNYSPSFTSNIISSDAKLELDDINEYIYLGPIKLSLYIQKLYEHSEIVTYYTEENNLNKIHFLDNLTFKPNLLYCGKENYLITSLTYNTPVPKELEEELEFTSSNITVIKDYEGNNTLVKGVPNKKTLYGKNGNKFVQLDVKNYNISTNNDLTINNNIVVKTKTDIFKKWSQSYMSDWFDEKTFPYKFDEENTINTTPNLKPTSFIKVVGEYMYFATKSYSGLQSPNPLISFNFLNSDTNYTTVIDNLSYEVDKVALSLNIENDYSACLEDLAKMSDSDLIKIFEDRSIIINGHSYTIEQFGDYTNENGFTFKITPSFNNNTLQFECSGSLELFILFIVRVKIKDINYSVMYNPPIDLINDTFIHTEKTTKYAELENKKYTVDYLKTLRHSTLTFNDLVYEPNIDGHRLFIRDGLCVYENNPPAIIFYRKDKESINFASHKNNIHIFTGPHLTT